MLGIDILVNFGECGPYSVGFYLYFPNGLLFIKEGDTTEMCACIINTMLCVETGKLPEIKNKDSYPRLLNLYQGKN